MTSPEHLNPIDGNSDSDYDSDKGFESGRPENKPFICGVVEGFYGRPWNTNQRLELFSRMKEFGMNTYLYAPKDDVKHRAYWRDLYTVEESESLTELIQAANSHDIEFVYAISPGLDITYSSNKDVTILRRKLDQVASFGCKAFALLFDDIEPEMNKSDKEVFQSFAHAQASVTNQMYEHLKQPSFMFCPTEYCSTRAVPTVTNSQYLNTIGEKLLKGIEFMWTGPKVVSKVISASSIKQLTRVIRRPPLIWDNIHANDYDQKRIFLGPFCGRSPALIPLLAGVVTNPNCEFEPNFIALHTLASWSQSSTNHNDHKHCSIRPETLVETEGMSKLEINSGQVLGYDPRLALKVSLQKWLPTFYVTTYPDGGKPPPPKLALAPTPIDEPVIPGISSTIDPVINNIPTTVNTCMTVTPTTQTAPVGLAVGVDKLVGKVDVPPEAEELSSNANGEPMDVIAAVACPPNTDIPEKSLLPNSLVSNTADEDGMQVDDEVVSTPDVVAAEDKLTVEDLEVVCDMFYLPYEHGSRALYLLTEFDWLKTNAHILHSHRKSGGDDSAHKHLVDEWKERAVDFETFVKDFNKIVEKFSKIPNRCLLYDMNNYLWDLRGTISLLNTFIKWLGSTKGYNQAFMSGDNEPWVFRGGLTGELQRSLPLDATDLFVPPRNLEVPTQDTPVYSIRPYLPTDEVQVYDICTTSNAYLIDGDSLGANLKLIPDLLVGGYLTLCNQYCFVLEDDDGICGYVVAAPDAKDFHQKMSLSWLSEMKEKYPLDMSLEPAKLSVHQKLMREFHDYSPETSQALLSHYPAIVRMDLLPNVRDVTVNKRLLACVFSALKSVGVSGAHCISLNNSTHHEAMYRYLGFSPAESNSLTTTSSLYSVLVRHI